MISEPKRELQNRARRQIDIHYDNDAFVRQYVIEIMVAVSQNLQRRMNKEKLRDQVLTYMTVVSFNFIKIEFNIAKDELNNNSKLYFLQSAQQI